MALFEPLNERDHHHSPPPQKKRNNRADADFEQVEGVQEHTSVIPPLAEFLEDREPVASEKLDSRVLVNP